MKLMKYMIRFFYMLTDAFLGYLAIFLACLFFSQKLAFDVTFSSIFFDSQNPFRELFAFWLLIIILISYFHHLYHTDRDRVEVHELWRVLQANAVAASLMIVYAFIFKFEGLPRSVVGMSFILMVSFFSLWRIFKKIIVRYLVAHGYNNFNVLIIGAGRVGVSLKQEIERNPSLGLKVVGFLDDYPDSLSENVRSIVLGHISNFRHIAQKKFVDQVFITIHHNAEIFRRLVIHAQALGVAVKVIPQGYDLAEGEFSHSSIGFIPVLEYSQFNLKRKQIGKRFFDFMSALAGFIVLSPLFLIISVGIKLTSRGPVFYSSKRYGYKGQKFNMIKFRTMTDGAHEMLDHLHEHNEADGPIFKMRNDPRVTPFGKILRKYSLDELPQLINVIKGDMSLVGPRPFPIEQIEKDDLRQLRRLGVRPGITGMWQIKGRSDISFNRLLKWDIWYINNWSFWLDISILWRTIPVVVKGRGAY